MSHESKSTHAGRSSSLAIANNHSSSGISRPAVTTLPQIPGNTVQLVSDTEGSPPEKDKTQVPTGSTGPEKEKEKEPDKPTERLTSNALWIQEAEKLKKTHKELDKINTEKIALVLMVYRQGIFNPVGKGGNPRYIRSDENTAIKLTKGGLTQAENKAGEIPDIYQGITPNEWQAIVQVLGKSGAPAPVNNATTIDEHIKRQREVSDKIMTTLKIPAPEKDKLPMITLIFDNNYPGLIIHFPALLQYIKENQEDKGKNKSKKSDFISSGQGIGMTKFLMGRLMNLCNSSLSAVKMELVEQSSFGFQRPTLGDMGTNMSIRLSPGISDEIIAPATKALLILHDELKALMEDTTTHAFDQVKAKSEISNYWDPGIGGRGASADVLRSSYNKEKTPLNHLLYTQVEKGGQGRTIIARTLERDLQNIIHLTNEDHTLKEWAKDILALHTPDKLTSALKKGTLTAPQLLTDKASTDIDMDTHMDDVASQRLALFQSIAKSMEKDPKPDNWEGEVSDSEFEADDNISGGKVVVPSGMASLNQLLGNEVKTKTNQVAGKMQPGLYYEDFDHAKKNFKVAGYTTADLLIADLNPNITTDEEKQKAGNIDVKGILGKLAAATAKVWMIDLTSAMSAEQGALFHCWKENAKAELLITLVSALKNQELGLNTNPHGLTHWAYKGTDAAKQAALKNYFTGMQKNKTNKRSKISNHMRRHFKTQGSYSWGRIGMKRKRLDDPPE